MMLKVDIYVDEALMSAAKLNGYWSDTSIVS